MCGTDLFVAKFGTLNGALAPVALAPLSRTGRTQEQRWSSVEFQSETSHHRSRPAFSIGLRRRTSRSNKLPYLSARTDLNAFDFGKIEFPWRDCPNNGAFPVINLYIDLERQFVSATEEDFRVPSLRAGGKIVVGSDMISLSEQGLHLFGPGQRVDPRLYGLLVVLQLALHAGVTRCKHACQDENQHQPNL